MTAHNTTDTRRAMLSHLTLTGAAALVGSAANAQIVVTNVNQTVGFAPGDLASFTSSLPGVNQFQINTRAVTHSGTLSNVRLFDHQVRFNGVGSMQVRGYGLAPSGPFASSGIIGAPAGGTFFNVKLSNRWPGNANRNNGMIQHVSASTASGTHFMGPYWGTGKGGGAFYKGLNEKEYFAFRFQDSTTGKTDYGWIEAEQTGNAYFTGPTALSVNIIAYAYDASGATIHMGQTSVPEPSQALALAAFSALTLGAAGVRRLKALQN